MGILQEFSVKGCRERSTIRTSMRVQFLHRHVRDTVIILEEGNHPHPRCLRCDMLVPWKELNGRHITTAQCTEGVKRKRRQLAAEEMRESAERAFQAYGRPIKTVTLFKYLGRVMTESDNIWPEVVGYPQKSRKIWSWTTRILRREGASPRVLEMFLRRLFRQYFSSGRRCG